MEDVSSISTTLAAVDLFFFTIKQIIAQNVKINTEQMIAIHMLTSLSLEIVTVTGEVVFLNKPVIFFLMVLHLNSKRFKRRIQSGSLRLGVVVLTAMFTREGRNLVGTSDIAAARRASPRKVSIAKSFPLES